MIQLALCYIALGQSPISTKIPQPPKPTLLEVSAKASQLAKQLNAPIKGQPQTRWLEYGGGFYATWPTVSIQFYPTLQPKSYSDSSAQYMHAERWFGDEAFVNRTPWVRQAIQRAVPEDSVRADLKPDARFLRNRHVQAPPESTIEVRWTLQSRNGIPFHHANPPQVVIRFNSSTHKVSHINWRLNYKVVPPGKIFNKQRAVQRISDLFTAYFKRNNKPLLAPKNLDVQLMYVTDMGDRLYADGTGTWGTKPDPDVRTYQVAYVGVYGQEQIWLDAATLSCIGGIFGPR